MYQFCPYFIARGSYLDILLVYPSLLDKLQQNNAFHKEAGIMQHRHAFHDTKGDRYA